jgi:hypothetical protein
VCFALIEDPIATAMSAKMQGGMKWHVDADFGRPIAREDAQAALLTAFGFPVIHFESPNYVYPAGPIVLSRLQSWITP